ncbi:hypothetical protein OPIT5_05840 [Opitutaceae bacterium TAV5]|nr:hypothetical protein OPIT5_05840 [Opitutaceae bacterium TAV5]
MRKQYVASILAALLSAVPALVQGETVPKTFTDNFNRDNTPSPGGGLGSDWDITGSIFLNSNVAKTQNTGAHFALYNSVPLLDSFTIRADFNSQSNGRYGGILFNYVDSNNYSLIRFNFAGATTSTAWQFIERIDGTSSTVSSGTIAAGATQAKTWRALTLNSTDTAGQYTFTITNSTTGDTYVSQTITSASQTISGQAGFYFDGDYIWADNFAITTNVPPIPEPATVSLLLGSVFLAGAIIWRKRIATRR